MSRLAFAPKLREVAITDIKGGIGVFTPKADKQVSFAALKNTLKQAGYKLGSAEITVAGTLRREQAKWSIVADTSGQSFTLDGAPATTTLADATPGAQVEVVGDWKTVGEGVGAQEVVTPKELKKASPVKDATRRAAQPFRGNLLAAAKAPPEGELALVETGRTEQPERLTAEGERMTEAMRVDIRPSSLVPHPSSFILHPSLLLFAPIRTTSPGLTVFKGGAIIPRLSFTRQHLGSLEVNRQSLNVAVSYTPTPYVQLEVDVPFARTSFDDGVSRGSGQGLGNVTLWGKYRFYRVLETWGDRQASVRFGLELPTGKKDGPSESHLHAPAFVRQQLTPISGGLAAHMDAAYSQAHGRVVFGGNAAGVLRSERAGYRTGHELQVNTDFEYVIFPFKYRKPTGEVFAILETNFVRRWEGRVGGVEVPESRSTEYYLSPGLQYVATSRVVIEGSVQLPVLLRTGSQLLRTRSNVLVGVRYLF
ncbi:MAG: transporter [Acidobacteria bacterium]|nr:transporter [Acidobacteriota bacterium]